MVNCVGCISGIIVVIKINVIVNHYITTMTTIITTMVIIVIMMVNADCHYSKSCKIGRIISIMIRRIIGYINR